MFRCWIQFLILIRLLGFPGGASGKESTCQCMRHKRCRFDPWVGEDPLEKEMVPHSSTLAWEILWMEEPGGLQSMGSQKVGHGWVTEHTRLLEENLVCHKMPVMSKGAGPRRWSSFPASLRPHLTHWTVLPPACCRGEASWIQKPICKFVLKFESALRVSYHLRYSINLKKHWFTYYWLPWVLIVAHGICHLHCGRQDLFSCGRAEFLAVKCELLAEVCEI